MAPQVTLGLLGERMGRMERLLEEIKTDVKVVHDQALDRRVTKLESSQQWIIRILAGAFVSSGVAALVAVVAGS